MSKQNLNLSSQSKSPLTRIQSADNGSSTRIRYSQPKLHHFGSLETIQGNYVGQYQDGPNPNFLYTPR